MLLVILPCANVFVSVGVLVCALTLLLASHEVALVVVLVLESELTLALEEVVLKLTLVGLLRFSEVLDTC